MQLCDLRPHRTPHRWACCERLLATSPSLRRSVCSYDVVRDHFETFRQQALACVTGGLPRFVEEEFEGFLRCGFLAGARRGLCVRRLR